MRSPRLRCDAMAQRSRQINEDVGKSPSNSGHLGSKALYNATRERMGSSADRSICQLMVLVR